MTEEQKAQTEELVKRYEVWLKIPFTPTKYYPNESAWRKIVEGKIKELKNKLYFVK